MSRVVADAKSSDADFIFYTSNFCPYCVAAKRLFESKGLSYLEINFANDPELRSIVVAETGHRTVPVVFDMRGDAPVFVGGSDHLMEYL